MLLVRHDIKYFNNQEPNGCRRNKVSTGHDRLGKHLHYLGTVPTARCTVRSFCNSRGTRACADNIYRHAKPYTSDDVI